MPITPHPVLSIENVLLARYGEVTPDGTLTVVGAGISDIRRPEDNNTVLFLAATVLVDGPAGPAEHEFQLMLRDSSGRLLMEGKVKTRTEGRSLRRIPFVVPVVFPSDAQAGEWQVMLVVDGDMRAVAVNVS